MYKVIHARLAQLVEQPVYTGKVASSSLASRTIRELIGFLEAKMRDARSASQGFPPNFPNEFRIFGALARTDFSPRRRFEPKISLAQTFFAKRSESEAILSKDCASFIHSFICSSQSFCLCERERNKTVSHFTKAGATSYGIFRPSY